jgi:Mn2+/Fe2+ NRAMP family transporter
VAGASDNDPTTVGTMSVVGASTGYALSWLVVLIFPILAAVQLTAAQVGTVAKRGLQASVRSAYGPRWGAVLMVSVLAVNLITIAADLEAGAAAIDLMTHISFRWFVVPYGLVVAAILFKGGYDEVVRILEYVVLVFVAYIGAAFLAHPDWNAVVRATFLPQISLNANTVTAMLAVLGTTLTSYAYVWETQEEAEAKEPLRLLGLEKFDAVVGVAITTAIFWFTVIAVGATLGVHHQPVQTAQEAAAALTPIAGPAASYLFAVGLLASSFIAVPVLAATCGYVLGDEFGRPTGLSRPIRRAPVFYGSLAAALLIAMAFSLAGVPAITLLFWASIAGGLGTPTSLVFLLLVARNRSIMGSHIAGPIPLAIGWATAVIVTLVSLYFIWQQALSKLFQH